MRRHLTQSAHPHLPRKDKRAIRKRKTRKVKYATGKNQAGDVKGKNQLAQIANCDLGDGKGGDETLGVFLVKMKNAFGSVKRVYSVNAYS